ncbi:nickel-type superoxide dismutase maturation protease [Kitasatospora viridis]|uniref:Nickel-type superoxide dismutase maturation protease n=1 Tax=Kitasatospora viridis TaxID=281105 RepID=A0A561UEZ5_9ACTN|nr:nickel-type superoxide dismutase maturation protease [Kitasatospora viridis]TWF97957.1 nickel-type superoxide dismutase maturation protease [Kitasatospora viridis]
MAALRRRDTDAGPEPVVRTGGGLVPIGVVDVDGPSMVPTLYPGDRVVVRYGARVRPGAVLLVRHPMRQDLLVVKRAAELRSKGWWLLSDNQFLGNDSRDFGAVPPELVLGRVLARVSPSVGWLAPAGWLERALCRWPLGRVPGLAARFGVFRRLSPEL